MKTILNDSKDPTFNLALEEYVLKELDSDEDFVLLWQNANSVIIGRNQNTYEEINHHVVKEHDVKVVRRITGGGAVYHDLGNLNFSFITKSLKDNLNNYRKFTDPVIKALKELGVPAEFQGRNDIIVEGKKISGNAQAWHKNRMLHHGTMLFDTNLDFVARVLNVPQDKIESKSIKSNRARVTNIKPYLKNQLDINSFKHKLLIKLLNSDDILKSQYCLSIIDIDRINEIRQNRYSDWNWNYGESPNSQVIKERRYPGGKLQLYFDIIKGTISNFKMYGDFLNNQELSPIISRIENTVFEKNHLMTSLEGLDFDHYLLNITKEEFIDCILI